MTTSTRLGAKWLDRIDEIAHRVAIDRQLPVRRRVAACLVQASTGALIVSNDR
jgi:hypothetical protein